jgi:hypothetical protein
MLKMFNHDRLAFSREWVDNQITKYRKSAQQDITDAQKCVYNMGQTSSVLARNVDEIKHAIDNNFEFNIDLYAVGLECLEDALQSYTPSRCCFEVFSCIKIMCHIQLLKRIKFDGRSDVERTQPPEGVCEFLIYCYSRCVDVCNSFYLSRYTRKKDDDFDVFIDLAEKCVEMLSYFREFVSGSIPLHEVIFGCYMVEKSVYMMKDQIHFPLDLQYNIASFFYSLHLLSNMAGIEHPSKTIGWKNEN